MDKHKFTIDPEIIKKFDLGLNFHSRNWKQIDGNQEIE